MNKCSLFFNFVFDIEIKIMLKYLLNIYHMKLEWNDSIFLLKCFTIGGIEFVYLYTGWKQMQRQGQMENISMYTYIMILSHKGSVYNIMILFHKGSVYLYHDTVPQRQCVLISWYHFTKLALDGGLLWVLNIHKLGDR